MKYLQLVYGILFTAMCLLQIPISSTQSKMTQVDKDNLRVVCASIWSQSLANGWNMNEDVAKVVSIAVESILDCSKKAGGLLMSAAVLEIVEGFFASTTVGWLYVLKNAQDIGTYIDFMRGKAQHKACVNVAAASYRTAVEMASMDI